MLYVLIGKEKCNQCNIFKNLLDEKGIGYSYFDIRIYRYTDIPYTERYKI